MPDTFNWLDVERIAEELADAHPDEEPLTITFPQLRQLVEALEDFQEQTGHPVNERILEAIQQAWIDEQGDSKDD